MKRALLFGIAGAILLIIVGSVTIPRFLFAGKSYNGTLLDTSGDPEDFVLQSADGDVHLSDYRGELVVMYFGYTNCPDACPTTLTKLARAREALGKDAEKVQVLMISVDPERDNPERLRQYMGAFDATFVGLTGSEDTLRSIATQYGIFFQKADDGSASGYTVDHSTNLIVVDQDGHERLIMPYDLTVDQVANDLENLL